MWDCRTFLVLGLVSMLAASRAPAAEPYDPVGKRDPFKPHFVRPAKRIPGPLEKLDLDQLKLVAVVAAAATPLALVETPDGIQHAVRVGTLLGRNQGHVARIVHDGIVVEERRFRTRPARSVPHRIRLKVQPFREDPRRARALPSHPWAALR